MGILMALLSALSYAINNVLMKRGMRGKEEQSNEGYFVTVLCNTTILGLLFFVVLWLRGWEMEFSWTATLFFFLSGILTTGLGRMNFYLSMYRIGPTRSSAIKNGSPFFTLLFAIIILGESIQFGPALGMVLILSGIFLQGWVSFQKHQLPSSSSVEHQGKSFLSIGMVGYLLAVLSSFSFGIGNGVRKHAMNLLDDAFYGSMIGALASLIFLMIYESSRKNFLPMAKQTFRHWNPYFLAAGIFTSLGPLFLFLALSYTQVSYAVMISATEPMITLLLSYLFLKNDEKFTFSMWMTIILVFAGVVAFALSGVH